MTQAQGMLREDVELTFKRYILQETRSFEHEPQADLYRVNLLGRMLDRHDELTAKGMSGAAAVSRVMHEYSDIPAQMRDLGFEELSGEDEAAVSPWPLLSEDEAAQYIKESDAYLHKRSLGLAMCASCVFPRMIGIGIGSAIGWQAQEAFTLLGLVGMLAMFAGGVYSRAMARKPKKADAVKRGHFALSSRVRRKLTELREAIEEKARRRRGRGIAMLAGCAAPILVGAALDSLWSSWDSPFTFLGAAGMFIMIGAGVYQLIMAAGEKKTIKKLLDSNKK